jgi:hypothetical protein
MVLEREVGNIPFRSYEISVRLIVVDWVSRYQQCLFSPRGWHLGGWCYSCALCLGGVVRTCVRFCVVTLGCAYCSRFRLSNRIRGQRSMKGIGWESPPLRRDRGRCEKGPEVSQILDSACCYALQQGGCVWDLAGIYTSSLSPLCHTPTRTC